MALALIVGWTSDLSYDEPASFTPASLDAEYRTNDLMATFAYEDKRILVSGVVTEIGRESPAPLTPERAFIVVGDAPEAGSSSLVKCYFTDGDEGEASEADAMSVGESITVEGTLLGNGLMPILSSCTVQPR